MKCPIFIKFYINQLIVHIALYSPSYKFEKIQLIHITHVVLEKLLPKSWSFIPDLCFLGVRQTTRQNFWKFPIFSFSAAAVDCKVKAILLSLTTVTKIAICHRPLPFTEIFISALYYLALLSKEGRHI